MIPVAQAKLNVKIVADRKATEKAAKDEIASAWAAKYYQGIFESVSEQISRASSLGLARTYVRLSHPDAGYNYDGTLKVRDALVKELRRLGYAPDISGTSCYDQLLVLWE